MIRHRMHPRFGNCIGVCILITIGPAAMPTWAQGPARRRGEAVKQAQLRVTLSAGHKSPRRPHGTCGFQANSFRFSTSVARNWQAIISCKRTWRSCSIMPMVRPHAPDWQTRPPLGRPDSAERRGHGPPARDNLVYQQDPRRLTVQLDGDGDGGFTVTVEQLLRNNAFWIPGLDLYLAVGDAPLPLEKHLKELAAFQGRRVLQQVHAAPEASYQEYKALWEDMGSPRYQHARNRRRATLSA